MAHQTDNCMTPSDVCQEIYDYLSFLEEGGGPAKTSEEVHKWLHKMISNVLNNSDTVVDEVTQKYKERSKLGIQKYGTTLEGNKGDFAYWVNHLQEELMDATLYLQKLKKIPHED